MGTAGWYQRRVREFGCVRPAGTLPGRGTVGRCDGCRSFQFKVFLRRWSFVQAAGDAATKNALERHSPKRWRSRCRPPEQHDKFGELVRLFGHAAGGRVSERLLTRLGVPVSDNAILRQLKSHVGKQSKTEPLRAIAIDDWSWRKGFRYGTIVVDLERRRVAEVLKTRSAHGTAEWLKEHPGIEFVSRDRCGLYAQGIRKGAPSARQVADRFHLMQNLRENIEREMTSVSRGAGRPRLPAVEGDRHDVIRRQSRLSRQALFVNAKRMHVAGRTFGDIAVEMGVDRRTVAKWVALEDLPDRQRSTIKPSSPLYFQEFLERRWAAGDRSGRRLFHDVRNRGYIGSFSTLSGCCRLGARARRRVKRHRRRRSRHRQRLSGSGKPRPLIRQQAGSSRPWLPPLSA